MTDAQNVAQIARGLSEAMNTALERLGQRMVWVDQRSAKALEKRGLAKRHRMVSDALLGTFTITTITPLGQQVRDYLREQDNAE